MKDGVTMRFEHVNGENKGNIKLFALSTCVWCRKTKQFLDDLGAAYDYIFVDHAEGEEKAEVMDELRNWNPACSFPTLVINDEKCIVGFKEEQIREAIG
jgi:glutaredoxin-like protein NrdH